MRTIAYVFLLALYINVVVEIFIHPKYMKWKTDIKIEIESFLKDCFIFPKISYEFSKNCYRIVQKGSKKGSKFEILCRNRLDSIIVGTSSGP